MNAALKLQPDLSQNLQLVRTRPLLKPGMRVKVNNHPATILRVIQQVQSYDPFRHQQHVIPLLNVLYEVEVQREVEYKKWHERQVYIPPSTNVLKLFADEFGMIVPNEEMKRVG